ncbi:hypothetical protein MASR2M18_11610 [Ignavibacteria bacterium]|nr:leucine-rich repeat domain-containing protein [Bacteroidota bacterium]MCZ2132378.1 leucine-rich repeat domain-containing protein [Bacteroidota bacterium]
MFARIFTVIFIGLIICGSAQSGELGKRYLKLGNTYRESGNFDKAEDYLKQGKKMVVGDGYWSAAGDEYLGYLYRDMAGSENYSSNSPYFLALAKEYFEKALSGYRKYVKQPDGSPSALRGLQDKIVEINSMMENVDGNASPGAVYAVNGGKIINYDNSKLKGMPDNLPIKMENFSAANNRLKEFPSIFSRYTNLQFINLKNNRISTLGAGLGDIKNLRVLNLSGNRIKTVPTSVSSLKQLEILDLSNNKLREIPTAVISLQRLKVLDISGNNIPFSQISVLIKNMPNTNILFDRYIREENEDEGTP